MKPVLLIDFGSTNTKVTAVDLEKVQILGTAASYTTVETDINHGLHDAVQKLEEQTGAIHFEEQYACSSAAGGLKMAVCGLVPDLTAEAARLASLGAGAKVVKRYSFQLIEEDIEEIEAINPDIFLLAGGVDGGNSKNILHNARMLSGCRCRFPVLLAGNRSCAAQCAAYFAEQGNWEVYRCQNVMPKLGVLNVEPIQERIRELFLKNIIHAKGLSEAAELISGIMMPTPSAMQKAMELLQKGTKAQAGLGELIAVDLGGATTDVYSVATGAPLRDSVVLKGLPELFSKRTVEGDIGMRYSVYGIAEAVGWARIAELSGLAEGELGQMTEYLSTHTDLIPEDEKYQRLDYALACSAVETAVRRHSGTIEEVYTPMGLAYSQVGKDLTCVRNLILTGGAVIHNPQAEAIGRHACFGSSDPGSLRPKQPQIYIDRNYILAAMGLLAEHYPEEALQLMKNELGV